MFLLAYQLDAFKYDTFDNIDNIGPSDNAIDKISYRWVNWKRCKYRKDNIVCVASDDDSGLPIFGKISNICMLHGSMVFEIGISNRFYLDCDMTSYIVHNGCSFVRVAEMRVDEVAILLIWIIKNNIFYVFNVGLH